MQYYFLLLILLASQLTRAQKFEERFGHDFRPTTGIPKYYVVTEQKDGRWFREAYYLPGGTQAMEGWYKDRECKVADGEVKWFHENRRLQSMGRYENGKKSGNWLLFHDNGVLRDSSTYVMGHRRGSSLGWHPDGSKSDSSYFDAEGNGSEVYWYTSGVVRELRSWTRDTVKSNTWKYFHSNGQPWALEEYANGKRTRVSCFDEQGMPMNDCEEREAEFPNGINGWRKFLVKKLKPTVPVDNGAPVGMHTVYVQFVVNEDGSISDITAKTQLGFGMEEEVIRLMKASPKWVPALQFGKTVKAYRIQPVTFLVTEEE